MRLRRVKSYTTAAGKDYGRWDITLPVDLVVKKGWEQGDELEVEERGDSLIIRKKK